MNIHPAEVLSITDSKNVYKFTVDHVHIVGQSCFQGKNMCNWYANTNAAYLTTRLLSELGFSVENRLDVA